MLTFYVGTKAYHLGAEEEAQYVEDKHPNSAYDALSWWLDDAAIEIESAQEDGRQPSVETLKHLMSLIWDVCRKAQFVGVFPLEQDELIRMCGGDKRADNETKRWPHSLLTLMLPPDPALPFSKEPNGPEYKHRRTRKD